MNATILGAGAHGRVVLDILRAQGKYETIEFVDDNEELWGTVINGALVVGSWHIRPPEDWGEMVVALGHPLVRLSVAEEAEHYGIAWGKAIHPSAVVMQSAAVGKGNVISAGVVLSTDACLQDHVLVNTAAIVEHDSVLEEGATICPGAQIGGRVRIERAAFIGTGAIVLPRLTIGAGSVVAAGAVVTKNVSPRSLMRGMPARVVGEVGEDFDWRRVL